MHAVAAELTAQGFGAQLARSTVPLRRRAEARLLDLRLQARRLLAVHPDRRGPEPRQRDRARAEGEAREGAADRAGPDALARALRRADLARRLQAELGLEGHGRGRAREQPVVAGLGELLSSRRRCRGDPSAANLAGSGRLLGAAAGSRRQLRSGLGLELRRGLAFRCALGLRLGLVARRLDRGRGVTRAELGLQLRELVVDLPALLDLRELPVDVVAGRGEVLERARLPSAR